LPYELAVFAKIYIGDNHDLIITPKVIRRRVRRTDSLRAVAGDDDAYGRVGAVVDQRLGFELGLQTPTLLGSARVERGAVRRPFDAPIEQENNTRRLTLDGRWYPTRTDALKFALAGDVINEHYAFDCWARERTSTTDCADGYFSPHSFQAISLRPRMEYQPDEELFVAFSLGPKFESERTNRRLGNQTATAERKDHTLESLGIASDIAVHVKSATGWTYGFDLNVSFTKGQSKVNKGSENRLGRAMLQIAKVL
jgi:hypothetical protein